MSSLYGVFSSHSVAYLHKKFNFGLIRVAHLHLLMHETFFFFLKEEETQIKKKWLKYESKVE